MNKLLSFIRLDFYTVKPYLTIKLILLYGAIAVLLTFTSGNFSTGIGLGTILGTMFIGYPFAVGEKSNIDALYATLSVDRKTVVAGRYISTFVLNAFSQLFSLVIASLTLAVTGTGITAGMKEILITMALLCGIFIFLQAIQLPCFFKLNYSKAKFLTMVPYAILMILVVLGTNDEEIFVKISRFIESFPEVGLIAIAAAAVALLVAVSYNLSASFYKKREF